MRLLFDHTVAGEIRRFGLQSHLEDKPYYGRVRAFGPAKIAPAKTYGGLVSLSHGEYSVKPGVFSFAPPETSPLTVVMAGNTGQIMFEGSARLKEVTAETESFVLYPPDIDHQVTDYTAAGKLDSVVASAAALLGLRFVAVNARSPSPSVDYTATGTHQLLRILSDICAFFTHWIRIESGSLYFGDMLTATGVFTGPVNRYKGTKYQVPEPYARFIAGNTHIIGTTAYGRRDLDIKPVCATSQAVILQALYNIRWILEQRTISIKLPIDVPLPAFGQRFDWADNDIGYHAYVTARTLNYDYRAAVPVVTITGEGDFTR